MAKNIRGKRPCSICRKWFQPIPQQIKRQKTCSPACQNELHRRQCEKWNKKNKAYFKNNYLADKIDAIDQQAQSKNPPVLFLPQPRQVELILPMDIIVARLGKKNAVIIEYLVFQITRHVRSGPPGYA